MYSTHRLGTVLICLLLSFGSCKNEGQPTPLLPGSTGKAGEIVLVMKENHWSGELGEHLKNTLSREQIGLPQPEPMFDVVQIPPESFKGLFLTHRNILQFYIKEGLEPSIVEEKNRWATSQITIAVSAPSAESCMELLKNSENKLERAYKVGERNRIRQKFLSISNKDLAAKLKSKFGFTMEVPKDYVIASESEHFIWFRKETPEISQGVFVYKYPAPPAALSLTDILTMRDTIAKYKIPGPGEGTYMATMYDYPATTAPLNFKGLTVTETRGLWNVVGDFMGGPFISFSFLTPDQGEVICIDAYLYAPKFDKRNYLRQIEAVLYSLKLGS